jgi:hypothetical protein
VTSHAVTELAGRTAAPVLPVEEARMRIESSNTWVRVGWLQRAGFDSMVFEAYWIRPTTTSSRDATRHDDVPSVRRSLAARPCGTPGTASTGHVWTVAPGLRSWKLVGRPRGAPA